MYYFMTGMNWASKYDECGSVSDTWPSCLTPWHTSNSAQIQMAHSRGNHKAWLLKMVNMWSSTMRLTAVGQYASSVNIWKFELKTCYFSLFKHRFVVCLIIYLNPTIGHAFLYNIHFNILCGWFNLYFEWLNLNIFKQTQAYTLRDMSVSFIILLCWAWSYKQMCKKIKLLVLVKVYKGSMIKALLACYPWE